MDAIFKSLEPDSSPHNVHVRVSFTKIFKVDTLNQTFEAEALIESKWRASELQSAHQGPSQLAWKPCLYIDNAVNEPREQTAYSVAEENGHFVAYEISRLRGVFSESLELENFPLDMQNLTLVVTSRNSAEELNFVVAQAEFSRHRIANQLDR